MTARRTTRLAITAIMNVVLALALVLLARVIVEFFGAIATAGPARTFVMIVEPLVLPFELTSPRTPYGGVFDTDAALTVVLLVLMEWGLSAVRLRE